MKNLYCTVLAYEGPILRAYLSVIKNLGYKVNKVIKLYNGHQKLQWLPQILRNPFLFSQESLINNYWPIKFFKDKKLSQNIINSIIENYNLGIDFFDLIGKACINYSEISDECIYFDWGEKGWQNEKLFELLKSLGPQTYLFTGGGLVPKCILELPNTEFVHVHPGFLPYTRGADGILWSILTRGKAGAACFYMVPKLDEGNMILTEEYPSLQFERTSDDLKTLYRLIFSFYDPAIRALCLKHVLEQHGTLCHLPSVPQDTSQGITFHFMHDKLKKKLLDKIFCYSRKSQY